MEVKFINILPSKGETAQLDKETIISIGGIVLQVESVLEGITNVHHSIGLNNDISENFHPLNKDDIRNLLTIAGLSLSRKKIPVHEGKRWHIGNSVQIRLRQGIPNNLGSPEYEEIKHKIGEFYIDCGRLRRSNFDENGTPTEEAINTLCQIMGIQ